MKTKICPHCGKELPAEAVLCKYCHNLLIDEDGNMTPAQTVDDEEKTKPFRVPASAIDEGAGSSADEVFPEHGRLYHEDDDYDDDDDYEDDDEDEDEDDEHKRLLIITACITLGILVVVIAAIIVGMQLFGKGGKTSSDVTKNKNNSSKVFVQAESEDEQGGDEQSQDEQQGGDEQSQAEVTEDSQDENTEDSEAVTDESSEDETADSQAVTDESSETETDSSAAETTESSEADTASSATESVAQSGGDYESIALAAAGSQISGNVTSSQFRTDDGTFVYYYFFTDDNHGYSVAYNKNTGECIVVQSY